MYYENVGSPVLLIDTIGKFYSNCGSRDCIRSPTINATCIRILLQAIRLAQNLNYFSRKKKKVYHAVIRTRIFFSVSYRSTDSTTIGHWSYSLNSLSFKYVTFTQLLWYLLV